MFLDFLIPLFNLDLGWFVLAILRNLWWFFAFLMVLHFFEPGKRLFPGYLFTCAFTISFGAFFGLMGIAFPSFVLIFIGWAAITVLVRGTRLEKHEISLVIIAFFLATLLPLWLSL